MSTFEAEDVARLRIALARLARQLERQTAGEGVTHTQMSVLGTVCRSGPLGVSELSDLEGLNPTMLSRVIGKLLDQGLISRAADPDDGRAARVEVTDAGRHLHERLRDRRTELLTRRLSELDQKLADDLLAALPALEAMVRQPEVASTGR